MSSKLPGAAPAQGAKVAPLRSARRGATAFHNIDAEFPDLVAHDELDYVRIAAGLAGDPARLAALRRKLRPAMAASPVCDTKRFARDFQSILAAIR